MHDELSKVLDLLMECRKGLIQRTIDNNHDLFRGFFDFEDDGQGLTLLFERERLNFINSNLEAVEVDNNESNVIFHSAMKKLITAFYNDTLVSSNRSSYMLKDIFIDKLSIIDGLLAFNEKSNLNMGILKVQMSKDNRIFERELKKLKGD